MSSLFAVHGVNPRVYTPGTSLVIVVGKFKVGATGAVGAISCTGKVSPAIVRDSAGKYTFTLPNGNVTSFDAKVWGLTAAANNIHMLKIIDHDETAGTIQIECDVETESADAPVFTATDPTENTYIHFSYLVSEGDL